jgi:hypothetical protein
MTEAQERQYEELNKILEYCYLKHRTRKQIEKATNLVRVMYRLTHLQDQGYLTKHGSRNTSCYISHKKHYPIEVFDAHCLEMGKRVLKPKPEVVPVVEATPTLADARYVHKMEYYSEKYTKQMNLGHKEFKRPKVYVGSIGEMV